MIRCRFLRHASTLGLTLIELLVVVSIIAILAIIGMVNFSQATERSLMAAGAANLRTVATALQTYYVDYNTLPPADREAGPFQSHTIDFVATGNGPASGGSWDGLPWLLIDLGYIKDWKTMFCPKYLRLYSGGQTIRGGHPRFHNFRYAYNSSGLASGGHLGGTGVMSGTEWIVRDLYVSAESGWYGASYPNAPADYKYPWGAGNWDDQLEQAIFSDFAVNLYVGGTNHFPGNHPADSP